MKKDKETLIQRIKNDITTPYDDEFIRLIKPALRITPSTQQANKTSLSKFGGLPLIRKDEDWPRSDNKNNPYAFLLQIDLEEIRGYELETSLPEKGVLSFWYNLENWEDGKVICYPNKEDLIVANPPIELIAKRERSKLPIWKKVFTNRINFKLFKECKVTFHTEYHAPSWDSLPIELFHLRNHSSPRDLAVAEAYIDDYCEEHISDHHLLGYYVGLQDSLYELREITKGKLSRKLNETTIKAGLEWKLLMQIDSDKRTDMAWADWGKILFFIQEEDLMNRNFARILTILDTT